MKTVETRLEKHPINKEPYYLASGKEIEIAISAHKNKLPLLLKGPTGCGKTRFMQLPA